MDGIVMKDNEGIISGRSRDHARAALAAAEKAGFPAAVVRTTDDGYLVPLKVLDAYEETLQEEAANAAKTEEVTTEAGAAGETEDGKTEDDADGNRAAETDGEKGTGSKDDDESDDESTSSTDEVVQTPEKPAAKPVPKAKPAAAKPTKK